MGRINIAIDGVAGVGKGTLAKRLARTLNYNLLDAGSMYRALAYSFNNIGISPELISEENLDRFRLSFLPNVGVCIDDKPMEEFIRTPEVGSYVASYGKIPKFKSHIIELQKSLTQTPGWVAEGRNMACDVMPNAEVKIYLWASPQERAKRRLDDFVSSGRSDVCYDSVLNEIIKRDELDYTATPPLVRPEITRTKFYTNFIDNSTYQADDTYTEVLGIVNAKLGVDKRL